jgi:hypothetical protein
MEVGMMDVSEGRIIRPTRFMTLLLGSGIGGPRDGNVIRSRIGSHWLRH